MLSAYNRPVNHDLQLAEERRPQWKSIKRIELLQKDGGSHAYTLISQMYCVKFSVYTSPAHKPVMSRSYSQIPQTQLARTSNQYPSSQLRREMLRRAEVIIKSWWGWHLTSHCPARSFSSSSSSSSSCFSRPSAMEVETSADSFWRADSHCSPAKKCALTTELILFPCKVGDDFLACPSDPE